MKTRSRQRAGAVALAAFLTTSALGFAGCGTSTGVAGSDTASGTGGTATATAATVSTAASAQSVAWNTCPKDRTDCAYPGACGRYTDSNGDGICDLSQDNPGTASALTLASTGSTADDQTGYCPLGPCAVCGICAALSA